MSEATQKPAKILLIEDEKRIADFLQRGLESNNYAVEHSLEAPLAWRSFTKPTMISSSSTDAADMDGLAVSRRSATARSARRADLSARAAWTTG